MSDDRLALEEVIAEGYEAQAECYARAIELLEAWLAGEATEEPEAILALLERQQQLVTQAAEIDLTLQAARARWHALGPAKPGPRLQEALERVQELIGRLMSLNDLLREQALRARQQVRAKLDRLRAEDAARSAYRNR